MPDRKRTIGFPDDDDDPALRKGHRYLLAIGIDQYGHYPRLYNAVRDAREFVALMREKYGFSGERATVVTLFDGEATGENIQAQLEDLADRATENDHCILYFSGHGAYNKTLDEGYWIPVDAKKGERRGYLHNTVVQKILSAIKSRHTFLIADSCFSGSMFVGTPVRDAADSLERDPSRWGLTSGRNEVVADGKPGDHSPFAKELLHLLRNSEQPLGVATLCAKMMEIVTANAGQTPRGEPLAINGHRGGQYVFRPTDAEATAWKLALERDTVQGYEGFLQKYPGSAHRASALARLAALQADADWAHTERLHTQVAYFDFREKHPKDARVATAEQRMYELADDQKWKEADARGGLLDYTAYLSAYPQGRHAEKARHKIKTLREPEPPPVPPPPRPVPLEPKLEVPKPPILVPEPNPSSSDLTYELKALTNPDLPAFKKSTKWRLNRLLMAGISVLFLLGFWLGWRMFYKQPTATKEKSQTPAVSNPPAPTAPEGFVFVKGGTFQMGSNSGESDEKPVHAVTLSDFYRQEREVTLGEFKTFVDASGYKTDAETGDGSYKWNGKTRGKQKGLNWRYDAQGKLRPESEDKHPVNHVSWNDATEYAKWLTTQQNDGKHYRLPTEAEWEYAAGNGAKHTTYSWGNGNPVGKKGGNVADETAKKAFKDWTIFEGYTDGFVYTAPVGSFGPNDFGLYDMIGNVREWCNDWYGDYPATAQTNPTGPEKGVSRVRRGGSWYSGSQYCRAAYRSYDAPADRGFNLGFRLVSPLQ